MGLANLALRDGKLAHVIHQYREAARASSEKSLTGYARREADYYAMLNDDDDFLTVELRRINWLQYSLRVRKIAARVTNASILVALISPYVESVNRRDLLVVGFVLIGSLGFQPVRDKGPCATTQTRDQSDLSRSSCENRKGRGAVLYLFFILLIAVRGSWISAASVLPFLRGAGLPVDSAFAAAAAARVPLPTDAACRRFRSNRPRLLFGCRSNRRSAESERDSSSASQRYRGAPRSLAQSFEDQVSDSV